MLSCSIVYVYTGPCVSCAADYHGLGFTTFTYTPYSCTYFNNFVNYARINYYAILYYIWMFVYFLCFQVTVIFQRSCWFLTTKTVETVLYSDSDLAKLVLLFFNIKIIWDRTSEDCPKLLLDAAWYDGEIWHADEWRPCPGLLLVFVSIGSSLPKNDIFQKNHNLRVGLQFY